MWVVSRLSHLHWGEKHWYSVLHPFLCQPRSTAWMSQRPKPPRHTLLPLSPLRQSTLSLTFSQFLSPSTSLFSLSSWFSPSFTFTPLSLPLSLSLSSITWGLYFSKFREKRHRREIIECLAATENPRRIQRWPQFSAHFFLSLVLLTKNFKVLCERRVCSPGEHQRTSRNTRTSTRPQTVPGYEWKSVEGKAWWDFSAAPTHTFYT